MNFRSFPNRILIKIRRNFYVGSTRGYQKIYDRTRPDKFERNKRTQRSYQSLYKFKVYHYPIVIDKMVSDCRKTNDAKKFLKNYCGIDLDNDDMGVITGADAGGSTVKTKDSIVPEEGNSKLTRRTLSQREAVIQKGFFR